MIAEGTRRCFELYAEGRIDFNVFSLRTRPFWVATARYLLQRWRASDAVEPEDLVQELLVEAWRAFPKHDPARGGVTDFVCYEATSKAKRWLHGQRGRRKCSRSDKAPSRHALRFCYVTSGPGRSEEGIDVFLESVLGEVAPEQLDRVDAVEHRRQAVAIVSRALLSPNFTDEEMALLRAFIAAEGHLLRACGEKAAPGSMVRLISRVIEGRREERFWIDQLFAEEENQ